jgi:hypothetical protein
MNDHDACRRRIKAHFSGRIASGDETLMRHHLPGCEPCRRHYERYLLLSDLDPSALDARERIGRGLGVLRHSPPIHRLGALLAAAAVAGCLLLALPGLRGLGGSFQARGSARNEPPLLEIYHSGGGRPFEMARNEIGAGDELAFAYANARAYAYLAVCGIDEHGHVYWYHPAWTSAADDPESVPIEAGMRLHELPEAISHSLDGTHLRVLAVFTHRPRHVRELERELDRARRMDRPLAPALSEGVGDALVIDRTLRIVP